MYTLVVMNSNFLKIFVKIVTKDLELRYRMRKIWSIFAISKPTNLHTNHQYIKEVILRLNQDPTELPIVFKIIYKRSCLCYLGYHDNLKCPKYDISISTFFVILFILLVPQLTCPICPFTHTNPEVLQTHVNRNLYKTSKCSMSLVWPFL